MQELACLLKSGGVAFQGKMMMMMIYTFPIRRSAGGPGQEQTSKGADDRCKADLCADQHNHHQDHFHDNHNDHHHHHHDNHHHIIFTIVTASHAKSRMLFEWGGVAFQGMSRHQKAQMTAAKLVYALITTTITRITFMITITITTITIISYLPSSLRHMQRAGCCLNGAVGRSRA